MAIVSLEGYLIRWHNIGGGDRAFKVFTRDRGLIQVIAGRRKLEQYPTLDCPVPLDRAHFTLVDRRRHPGTRLVEYLLLERCLWLAADLKAWGQVMLFAEAVERLSADDDPAPEVYSLLESFLSLARKETGRDRVAAAAILKLFTRIGYRPQLEHCRRCGKPPAGRNRFLVAEGGFIHEGCAKEGVRGLPLSPGTIMFLKRLVDLSLSAARNLKGDLRVTKEADNFIEAYLHYYCQRKLGTQVFMGKLAELPAPAGRVKRAAVKHSLPRRERG